MAVGFGGLRDRNDGTFSVSFVFFIMRFQTRSILVGYVISVMVGFGRVRDPSDGRFWWVTRSK